MEVSITNGCIILEKMVWRMEWKMENENLKIGEIIIIKEDNLPPQKWLLGRIIQIHPGLIVKLIKLPIDQEIDAASPDLEITDDSYLINQWHDNPWERSPNLWIKA
jgi:hypothetical protein